MMLRAHRPPSYLRLRIFSKWLRINLNLPEGEEARVTEVLVLGIDGFVDEGVAHAHEPLVFFAHLLDLLGRLHKLLLKEHTLTMLGYFIIFAYAS